MDISIDFKQSKRPITISELDRVLRNYLGKAGKVRCEKSGFPTKPVWFCTLPGPGSFPLKGLKGVYNGQCTMHEDGRWFEVWWNCGGSDQMVITTRAQDEFTMDIAQGFAKLCARFWGGTIGPE